RAPQPVAAGLQVSDLMSPSVVTVVPDDPLATAWTLMRRHRIRHLPVVMPDGRLIGVITHRDLLAASPSTLDRPSARERIALSGCAGVAEGVETRGSGAAAAGPAGHAGDRMLRHKIGCLPVVDPDGHLRGIVTGDDFVRWAAARMAPPEAAQRSA